MNNASTPNKTPQGFLERLFARLEFLMAKRTISDRARHARNAGQQGKPPV
jgi:hypothetical protein